MTATPVAIHDLEDFCWFPSIDTTRLHLFGVRLHRNLRWFRRSGWGKQGWLYNFVFLWHGTQAVPLIRYASFLRLAIWRTREWRSDR